MITCYFEGSRSGANLRHLTVDLILCDRDRNVLLVERAPHLVEGGKWALVGGYMERDENAVEAIRRELAEETGYTCSDPELVAIVSSPRRPGDDRQSVTLLFAAMAGHRIAHIDDDECTQVRWFPLDSLSADLVMAFDHGTLVDLYCEYSKSEHRLPVLI